MVDYFQAVRRDGSAAIQLLATIGDINVRNEEGENLLHVAIAYGNQAAASFLIQRGIDVNAQDSKGQTPLHSAADYQKSDVTEQILAAGGDMGIADIHGNTALWNAVFNARGKYECVDSLAKHGAARFANRKNRHGRSPLDFAQQIGDEHLVKLIGGAS